MTHFVLSFQLGHIGVFSWVFWAVAIKDIKFGSMPCFYIQILIINEKVREVISINVEKNKEYADNQSLIYEVYSTVVCTFASQVKDPWFDLRRRCKNLYRVASRRASGVKKNKEKSNMWIDLLWLPHVNKEAAKTRCFFFTIAAYNHPQHRLHSYVAFKIKDTTRLSRSC